MPKLRPMLAAPAPDDLSQINYPVLVSPKLDGLRCLIVNKGWYADIATDKYLPYAWRAKETIAVSRSLKPIPNFFLQEMLDSRQLAGLDGELIVGSPTAPDVFRRTDSALMTRAGEPDFCFHVFDHFYEPQDAFENRNARVYEAIFYGSRSVAVPHRLVRNKEVLLAEEHSFLSLGYEGIIIRAPKAPYKFNRSTTKQGWMLKLKRFLDAEAEVIGFEERYHNAQRGNNLRAWPNFPILPSGKPDPNRHPRRISLQIQRRRVQNRHWLRRDRPHASMEPEKLLPWQASQVQVPPNRWQRQTSSPRLPRLP